MKSETQRTQSTHKGHKKLTAKLKPQSLEHRNLETSKLRNFEAWKPRNFETSSPRNLLSCGCCQRPRQNCHAHGHAVAHLFEHDRLCAICDGVGQFHPANHGPGMHE